MGGTAVAAALLLLAAILDAPWLGTVGVAAGVAALLFAARSDTFVEVATRTGMDRLAGAVRMILTVAVVARVVPEMAVAYGAVAAATLGCWALVLAVLVAATTRHPPAVVRNLAGPPVAPVLLGPAAASRTAITGFNVVDAVAAITALVGGAWLGLAVLVLTAAAALGVAVWLALPSLGALRVARTSRTALTNAVRAYDPQAVVHLSLGGAQARSVLGQWLSAFEALNLRTLILIREPSRVADLASTSLPIVLAPTGRDVTALTSRSVGVAFYVANGLLNGDMLRHAHVRHVFLNHGDSDKSASANPFNKVYDELWVAGDAAIDRYLAAGIDIPRERFVIVGRPQLQGLPIGPRPSPDPVTVLYAPTFEGYFEDANYSSLERMGVQIVQTLLRERPDVRIVFKPHPATGQHRAGMAAAQQAVARLLRDATGPGSGHDVVLGGGVDALYQRIAEADVLVTDVSSVATDFLWTERPIIATNPKALPPQRYAELFPTLRCAYLLEPDGSDVTNLLATALDTDPLASERRQTKGVVLGNVGDAPMAAFVAAADRAYERALEHAGTIRNTFTFSDSELDGGPATAAPQP